MEFDIRELADVYSENDIFRHVQDQLTDMCNLIIYILLRGGYQNLNSETPMFLLNVIGIKKAMQETFNSVSSIDKKYLPIDWVKIISYIALPIEIQNRLMICIPGYRFVNCIRCNTPDFRSADIDRFHSWIKNKFRDYDWDLFAGTRSQDFNRMFPNFSRNLHNFVRVAYSEDSIKKFVDSIKNHWCHSLYL